MEEIILKEAIAAVKSLLQNWNAGRKVEKFLLSSDGAEEALAHHLKFVENWSRQISLQDLPRSRSLEETFVNLRLSDSAGHAIAGSVEAQHILESGLNTILLGHVGAGKTTLVKHLCQHLLHEVSPKTDSFAFPIVVLLKGLRRDESISEYLLNMLEIKLGCVDDEMEREKVSPNKNDREKVLARYLDTSRAILFLDGLDEMAPESRGRAQREISSLANILCSAKFVLTSRLGVIEAAIDNSEFLYICPLDARQVRNFIGQWLGSEKETEDFLAAIYRTPYHDTIDRPLILVHLCMVYHEYGELPGQPVLIYQKVIQLLLEKWDRQRDLRRVSRYGRFGPERKQQFLGSLAYRLATSSFRAGSRYHDAEIRVAYRFLCPSFDLPLDELEQVIAEIESHTGLFVSAGLGQFEFSHKSLQEYLCADYISRLPDLKKHLSDIIRLPEECAIATVLSASPNEFFEFLSFSFACGEGVKELFGRQIPGFWIFYLTRLRLEGATFRETPTLGFAFLFVASLAWGRWGESATEVFMADERVIRLIDRFLEIPAVHNSVRQASAAFCVESMGSQYADCHLLSGGNSVPQNAPKRLVLHTGLVVGPSWCGTI